MKKIWDYLLDYQKQWFVARMYVTILLFLCLCIGLNYYLDFEDSYIDTHPSWIIRWIYMVLFHMFPYIFICFIFFFFRKKKEWLKSKDFWFRCVLAFVILGFDRSFPFSEFMLNTLDMNASYFIEKCLNHISSLLLIVTPLLLLYPFLESKELPKTWYGLAWRRFEAGPYLFMLGGMVIIIGLGSFIGEIQDYYPRLNKSGVDMFSLQQGWSKSLASILYEFCYGSSFFSVEIFFRGFLILAFSRFLGPYVVLPMVGTYCFLHFGKPMGETISSIFGGYILGIITLRTRNIWGGIFIHIGVAWLMELFGWLHSIK